MTRNRGNEARCGDIFRDTDVIGQELSPRPGCVDGGIRLSPPFWSHSKVRCSSASSSRIATSGYQAQYRSKLTGAGKPGDAVAGGGTDGDEVHDAYIARSCRFVASPRA